MMPAKRLMVQFEEKLLSSSNDSLVVFLEWLTLRFINRFIPQRAYRWLLFPLLLTVTRFLDFFYPKNENVIVFGSNAGRHMTGSPFALFDGIHRAAPEASAYFMTLKPSGPFQISPFSLKGFLCFLRAKYIVSSHDLEDFTIYSPSSRKTHFTTWHGTPMKSIGHPYGLNEFQERKVMRYVKSVDYVITASQYEAMTLAFAYGYSPQSFQIIGQARNDSLVQRNGSRNNLSRYFPHLSGNEYVVLYAPTWRDTDRPVSLFPFEDFEYEEFEQYLEEENIIVLLRRHITDTEKVRTRSKSRILDFGFHICPDIYSVLLSVDLLLTDYSSIAFDYLLLDRPIGYIPYDLREYSEYRGFMLGCYDCLIAGPTIRSEKELIEFFNTSVRDAEDQYSTRRKELRQMFHSAQTSNTVRRFINLILE